MGENRIVEVQDKRGTKDCPDLFCNVIMKRPNTMATVSGGRHHKVSTNGYSLAEAKELYAGLGKLLESVSTQEKPEPETKIDEKASRKMGTTEAKPSFDGVVEETK